jgi:hypothetical protein
VTDGAEACQGKKKDKRRKIKEEEKKRKKEKGETQFITVYEGLRLYHDK